MNPNYKHKYIKYKSKYLELQDIINNISGGGQKKEIQYEWSPEDSYNVIGDSAEELGSKISDELRHDIIILLKTTTTLSAVLEGLSTKDLSHVDWIDENVKRARQIAEQLSPEIRSKLYEMLNEWPRAVLEGLQEIDYIGL